MRWRVAQALSKSWLQPAAAATPPPAAAAVAPSVGCRRLATAAQDGLQGDIIAPDVGLARIDGVNEAGFSVNNVAVEGAIMLSGDVFTLWRAQQWSDVTLDSLALLRLLRPTPDLLVLGTGRRAKQLAPELARQLHEMGVRVDAMDTVNAVATFNVLNQEARSVVGALLPQNVED